MKQVKITVLRKPFFEDLADEYLADGRAAGPCAYFGEGDEFLYEDDAVMPEGFCPWAWHDIYAQVLSLAAEAQNFWYKPGVKVLCCTDGIRPVIFSLKATDEIE